MIDCNILQTTRGKVAGDAGRVGQLHDDQLQESQRPVQKGQYDFVKKTKTIRQNNFVASCLQIKTF